MTILGLILVIVVIGVIVYLLNQLTFPEPFAWLTWAVRLIVILLLVFFLLHLIGVGGNLGLDTKL